MVLYWNEPRPGEYVSYKEITMLTLGLMFTYFATTFWVQFAAGNAFTGQTLGMTNDQLMIFNYVCQGIGYFTAPVNSWLTDNLHSKHGKYRVYIRLAVPSMILTLVTLWLPYEQMRDGVSPALMIAVLFIMGQCQGYIQNWFSTGSASMVFVMTPNVYERTRIMSITSVAFSLAPTLFNLYTPIMVDILPIKPPNPMPVGYNKRYTMAYYRGAYTPAVLLAPLALVAFYGTRERLVEPKSRVGQMSFANSIRTVAGNKIFWIKCFDSWNDFLESAKDGIWEMLVYRAHITSSSAYGVLNTLSQNAQFWAMIFSPWFIRKFGKKKIKVYKNVIQVLLIVLMFFVYKTPFALGALFIITFVDRFVNCGMVVDKAIESDMRDAQQYMVGERIDGSFGLISTYAGGAVNLATGWFMPWLYKKCGFDGNDYSVLEVYKNYDPSKPLSQQEKNPNCVLYHMLDVLIGVSVLGAIIDVIPWLFYDITENDQTAMIRTIRIRTMIEDRYSDLRDKHNYVEGCEAVMKAMEYKNSEKLEISKKALKEAKAIRAKSDDEKQEKALAIKNAKEALEQARAHNSEKEICDFVNFELNRFNTDFGVKHLELARLIYSADEETFYDVYEQALALANELPASSSAEESRWRRQAVHNVKAMKKSARLARKFFDDGIVRFDESELDAAYDLPETNRIEIRTKRIQIKKLNKKKNRFIQICYPYFDAKRTVELAEGYENIEAIIADYDDVCKQISDENEENRLAQQKLDEERAIDAERKRARRRVSR